jgi:hypothetical protein
VLQSKTELKHIRVSKQSGRWNPETGQKGVFLYKGGTYTLFCPYPSGGIYLEPVIRRKAGSLTSPKSETRKENVSGAMALNHESLKAIQGSFLALSYVYSVIIIILTLCIK